MLNLFKNKNLAISLRKPSLLFLSVMICIGVLASCSPKVEVEVPDKPITINLNIKVDHEIKIQVDKELDTLFEDDDLF